jgi:hypothetical protein
MRAQRDLLVDSDVWHASIASKLAGRLKGSQWEHFQACGRDSIVRSCRSCKSTKVLTARCDLKWCPRCQWRLTQAREAVITAWAGKITQPKHLVLTQRNFAVLTRKEIRVHQRNLARLRRTKTMRDVIGGCISVEITNEGKGWHLHSHWLVDARWLDMPTISRNWAGLVGQQFAICKAKDVRNTDYVREVSKYLVKGSDLAGWTPDEILQFVLAIRGVRFFFSFGSLFKLGPTIRQELAMRDLPSPECDCGSCDFSYMSEETAVLHELQRERR